jgi:hypothetical protein
MRTLYKLSFIGFITILMVGCYFQPQAPKWHKYNLILSNTLLCNKTNSSLTIFSTPKLKTFLFKNPNIEKLEGVEICSHVIRRTHTKGIKMESTLFFDEPVLSGDFIIPDRLFHKEYEMDTIRLTFTNDKKNYELKFVLEN